MAGKAWRVRSGFFESGTGVPPVFSVSSLTGGTPVPLCGAKRDASPTTKEAKAGAFAYASSKREDFAAKLPSADAARDNSARNRPRLPQG
jgi:hypothetical protein